MRILYCKKCKKFTLKQTCSCGNKTEQPKPAKFSPEDKWGKYRRVAKKQQSL
ncbi:ribosome biogenesis protein [archaeon]|jgi:H/ACA ribonucleoprotein complex subunit 3|nr:ribosome biogenesis protein [archaeon]MBT4417194.1 ribosome biogenesis protein [archaeon]